MLENIKLITNIQYRSFVCVPQSLVLYLAIIIPLEYLLTEVWLITPYVTAWQKTTLLFLMFFIVFFLNQWNSGSTRTAKPSLSTQSKPNHSLKLALWIIAMTLALTVNFFYTRHYQYLQTYPKIFKLSSNWTIQGMMVKIEGKNFGEPWQAGKVKVDEMDFIINKWSDRTILAKQPVPNHYFTGQLKVERYNGNQSKGWEFEIRDAKFLHQ